MNEMVLHKLSPIMGRVLHASQMNLWKASGATLWCITPTWSILSLNTIIYSPWHTPQTSSDPYGQWLWLRTQCEIHRKNKATLFLVGHIPPTLDTYSHTLLWKLEHVEMYQTILREYHDVISIQIFGHVHANEFRVSSSFPPLLTTGSISPLFGNNPTYSIYHLNDHVYSLDEWIVYGSNLSDIIKGNYEKKKWKMIFKTTSYGINSASNASEWKNFALR